jgi:hypothetical protein
MLILIAGIKIRKQIIIFEQVLEAIFKCIFAQYFKVIDIEKNTLVEVVIQEIRHEISY